MITPFAAIRLTLANAKLDADVRTKLTSLVDAMENELDHNSFEFEQLATLKAVKELQLDLIETLTFSELRENEIPPETPQLISKGEVDDDDDEQE